MLAASVPTRTTNRTRGSTTTARGQRLWRDVSRVNLAFPAAPPNMAAGRTPGIPRVTSTSLRGRHRGRLRNALLAPQPDACAEAAAGALRRTHDVAGDGRPRHPADRK